MTSSATNPETGKGQTDPVTGAPGADTMARLSDAFATEELASLRLLMFVRIAVSAAIIVFLLINFPSAGGAYWSIMTAVFGAFGVIQYVIRRAGTSAPWHKYAWIFFDLALVSFIILGGNPWLPEAFPPQEQLRFPNFDFLYVVVAVLSLSYTPRAVAWMGVSAVLCWGAGFLWILSQPETITSYDIPGYDNLPVLKRVELSNQVTFVNLSARIQEFFLMLVFAGTLAAGVWRSRRLLQRQVVAERARTNLSRYFSPAIVDEILNEDMGVTEGRTQKAAVLFADIVGFTRLSEKLPPADVMTLLREFHGRMGAAIFDHKGTIDKYIGDEVMATFGTPITGPDDAANAIACARTMRGALADWNRDRAETGAPPVDVGIGVDFGDVVIGNMGDERRLEFAVIGDTVNVASRLQSLTRERDAAVLVSGDVVEAAGTPTGLTQIGATAIRGRDGEVSLWTVS